MTPRLRIAGLAGILAGVGLAVEGTLWATSGWTADTFGEPATALAFLQDNGTQLRAAVFAGAYIPSLTLTIVFRIWAGLRLWRSDAEPALGQGRPGHQTTAPTLGS